MRIDELVHTRWMAASFSQPAESLSLPGKVGGAPCLEGVVVTPLSFSCCFSPAGLKLLLPEGPKRWPLSLSQLYPTGT